jgi:carbamoyl-phosphate synthase large subunit
LIAGIMEHIEEAGVHSGDSSCVLPTLSLSRNEIETIKTYTRKLARELNVIGLMNVQYAIKDGTVYVLEVNPRASRTVPYVSKATGVPLPKIAVGVMLGRKLADFADVIGPTDDGVLRPPKFFVKSPVFPFNKFPGVDPALGPEMRSTGEVMGVGENFGEAFAKAQLSAGAPLPSTGTVFISVNERHKNEAVEIARKLSEFGFGLVATRGTASAIQAAGLTCKTVFKVNEGRPNAVDLLKAGSLQLIIYTAAGAHSFSDEKAIRRAAVAYRVPCITTMSGAKAAAEAVASRHRDPIRVWSLQEIHQAEEALPSGAR